VLRTVECWVGCGKRGSFFKNHDFDDKCHVSATVSRTSSELERSEESLDKSRSSKTCSDIHSTTNRSCMYIFQTTYIFQSLLCIQRIPRHHPPSKLLESLAPSLQSCSRYKSPNSLLHHEASSQSIRNHLARDQYMSHVRRIELRPS
jgi:hypothetical protein